MKNIKTIVFVILALLGLAAAAVLVKKSTETRKGAYAGKVNLFLVTGNTEEPNILELCKDSSGHYKGKLIVKLDPSGYKIPGAALKFAFDETKVKIDTVTFHSAYGASIWNQDKANTEGVLKLTALSLQKELPATAFNLAEIQITGLYETMSDFRLIYGNSGDYQIVFESTSPTGDNTLEINTPNLLRVWLKAEDYCGEPTPTKTPTPTKPATTTNTKTPTPAINASPTPANDKTLEINNPGAVRVQIKTDDYCEGPSVPTETPTTCLHGVCKDQMCIQVPGCQDSECLNDEDCVLPPEAIQLNFKITFGGLNHQIPYQNVRLRVTGNGIEKEFPTVAVSFNKNGIGSGTVVLTDVPAGDGYFIFIKGPKHLARKFCEDDQSKRCSSDSYGLTLVKGSNDFDWSQLAILPGDYNQDAGEKIGKANSVDFAILVNELDSTGDNLKSDVNYNDKVEGGDVALFLNTLSEVYEEDN